MKKRIAIFGIKYFPSKGGTSRVVENLLPSLQKEFEIHLYCYRHPRAEGHIPGVKVIQFPEIPIKGIGVFLYYCLCCFHLLWTGKYDLVHVHKTDAAFFLPLLKLKFKLVVTSHALPYHSDKWSALGKWYFRLAERLFVAPGAELTAVAQTQCDHYYQTYQRRVRYIPNGIHPVGEIREEWAEDLLKEHWVEGEYLFFAARRLIPLKGCHTLLDALQKIDYRGTLLIAADTEQMPEYTRQLKEKTKSLQAKFLGYIDDSHLLNALIQRARFFIFPSEIEGMSMMLLEVGSVGTPMICSDIPQNTAVLNGEEVLFFESKNAVDLASKLEWAFVHFEEMESKAQKAQQSIESTYLVEAVARQYIDLYRSVLFPEEVREAIG